MDDFGEVLGWLVVAFVALIVIAEVFELFGKLLVKVLFG